MSNSVEINSCETRIAQAVRQTAMELGIAIETNQLDLEGCDADGPQSLAGHFSDVAQQIGIACIEEKISAREINSTLDEGFSVIYFASDVSIQVFSRTSGRKIEVTDFGTQVRAELLSFDAVDKLLEQNPKSVTLIAKRELACDSISAAREPSHTSGHESQEGHGGHGGHSHPKPLKRFLGLLRLDQRDIWTIALFALVAGTLTLATPLAIESLVNVVSWGTYLQPLLVLSLMLFCCLAIAGVLNVLQTLVVEMIQRRQFVRIVGDLSFRFPRAQLAALEGLYPRELANRLFDIVTIQKSSAAILLDGISIVLATVLGLLLLAFYHPFLLGFDIVLMISMLSITWILGRGGIRTAIDESIQKYKVVHWLQDVIASPTAFKINGGQELAVERANRLTSEYLNARRLQFRVVIRQVAFAIGLQVLASTTLLGLGGWLVIQQQLTLGQLVASELVVTVVVGAFAKAGKTLEKYYDLMAGVDKVGHLLDLPVDSHKSPGKIADGPAELRWDDLHITDHFSSIHFSVAATKIASGTRLGLHGEYAEQFSHVLAGLITPETGVVEIANLEAKRAAFFGDGNIVGFAGQPQIFHATVRENIDCGRTSVSQSGVRQALMQVQLWESVLRFPQQDQTMLQSGGAPLTRVQKAQLSIARAIAAKPRLLIVDGLLDQLDIEHREAVWRELSKREAPWTLVLVTNDATLLDRCDERIAVGQH